MHQKLRQIDLSQCRVALVANEKAGKRKAVDQIAAIRERLQPLVRELDVLKVHKGHNIRTVTQQAVRQGADIVATLGGDGTQSTVAGVLAGTGTVMAVLPGGTFNYFARELGVGETLDQALDTLAGGLVATRDLGAVNDRIFINNASFGVYPEILERRESIYRRWGRSRIAAYWSVLVALLETGDPMHLTLCVDGQTQDHYTPLAFAARSAYQLDNLGLEGADAVRNGHFALFLARGHKRRDLIGASLRLALGKVTHRQDFDLVIANDIVIETRRRRKLIAFDGEKEYMNAPFHLHVLRDALSVIVPAESPSSDAGMARTV